MIVDPKQGPEQVETESEGASAPTSVEGPPGSLSPTGPPGPPGTGSAAPKGIKGIDAWGLDLPLKARDLLYFWFGRVDGSDYKNMSKKWFNTSPLFDQLVRHYEPLAVQAIGHDLDSWRSKPLSCLALILLLDQVPRNLYRGTRKAFFGDPKALTLSRLMIESGRDILLDQTQRIFSYLPFTHSEKIEDQRRSLQLFTKLNHPEALEAAEKHLSVIQTFGRFPTRNAAMGRDSTRDELLYLADQRGAV